MPYSKVVSRYPKSWLPLIESFSFERTEIEFICKDLAEARSTMFRFYAYFRALELEARRPPPDQDIGMHERIRQAAAICRRLKVIVGPGSKISIVDASRIVEEKDRALELQVLAAIAHVPIPQGQRRGEKVLDSSPTPTTDSVDGPGADESSILSDLIKKYGDSA